MGVTNPFHPDGILAKINTVRAMMPDSGAADGDDVVISTLLTGEMELEGLMPWSSNYTFLATIQNDDGTELLGVYKPGDGERPLWDFPDRTLANREFASYLVSQILGWPNIPATVLRTGPHGLGSLQLFVDAEYEAHYFNMKSVPKFTPDFMNMSLFDFIVNNADRKGGHCLKDRNGKIWAIDHGLTFHTDPKLRTVIWEFSDDPIPASQIDDLTRLLEWVGKPDLCAVMADLISQPEIEAFKLRIARLVNTGQFPSLRPGRNVPYPPI
jgi:uncharacterized repeat protein (TIGR03843 family)